MMKKISSVVKLGLVSGVLVVGFGGCVSSSQNNNSPEKKAMMKMLMQRMSAMPINAKREKQTPIKKDLINESTLISKLETYPKTSNGVKFQKRKDGFTINGKSVYLDPEGKIVNYGYDWKDGSFFYLIKISDSSYKIKFNRVSSNKPSLDIAYVKKGNGNYLIETVSGKKFNGQGLILTSKGFIVTREGSAFIYNVGKETKNFATPTGWHIAYFQNGNIASTQFLLLERDVEKQNSSNPLADFWTATKELGNALGISKKEDYKLIDLNNPSKGYLINITLGDKEIQTLSECKRQNKFVQRCSQMDTRNSLYEPNGLKNFSHYYWSITWFKGKNTIFSISKESTNRKIYIRDLKTGKTVEVASRITGFPEFTAVQNKDGLVEIFVNGGFLPNVGNKDAESFLAENPDISPEKKKDK
jgi:hypothetical protein